MAAAKRWKNAGVEDRETAFNETGVRYSELLRLPYWHPVKFVVVESMHAFFLTKLQHHCRVLWGLNVNVDEGSPAPRGTVRLGPKRPNDIAMAEAWEIVRRGNDQELQALKVGVITHLNTDLQLPTGGHKGKLVTQLRDYVSQPLSAIHHY